MDEWDKIPAPQWNDFQSPMCNESYFSMQGDITQDLESSYMSETITEKSPLQVLSSNKVDFIDEIDKVKMTPIHIISPNKKNKENVVRETTYEDFLAKAVREIHLDSARKSGRKSNKQTPNKSDRVSDDQYYTPSDRLPTPENLQKSLMKTLSMKNNPVKSLEVAFQEVEQQESENLKTEDEDEEEKDVLAQEAKVEDKEVEKDDFVPLRLVTDKFTLKNSSNAPAAAKSKTQKVLPYQNRRLSMKKVKKTETKAQKPFVSTAEAIAKFQAGTPKRFRSVGVVPEKPSVLAKFAAKQLTQAVSPALVSKNRVRKTTILSQAQKEELEMDRFKANPIKANPLKNLKKPDCLKKIEKKPPTIPEPFKLTVIKKAISQVANKVPQSKFPILKKAASQEIVKSETKSQADGIVKKRVSIAPILKRPASMDLGKLKKSNSMTLCDVVKMPEFKKPIQEVGIKKMASGRITRATKSLAPAGVSTSIKNTVPVVIKSDGQAITVQEKEVTHFGIKIAQPKHIKHKAAPFSFDKRTKEFQEKKQQKIKQLQEEQAKKQKIEFHAKPVPVFKRSNSTPQLSSKNVAPGTKAQTTPQPFSFEQRDKMFLKKKQEILKQAQELDKKSRLFHANPAPHFKPVPVSTQFKNNLKKQPVICKNRPLKALPTETKTERKSPVKKSPIKKDPNKFKKILPKFELHSDKRAKERKEFDEKFKQKLQLEEEQKKKILEVQSEREKGVESELRKQMQVKARPMPEFKPVATITSNKQLTCPQSPAWAMKAKHDKQDTK